MLRTIVLFVNKKMNITNLNIGGATLLDTVDLYAVWETNS